MSRTATPEPFPMNPATTSASKPIGRPRAFDRGAALRRAMFAFWQTGYEGTSVADLTRAMGINAPSLYAAFGDKKRLFVEALALYTGDLDVLDEAIRTGATARDVVHAMLTGAARTYTGARTPKGCLLASAAASGSGDSADVRETVAAVRRRVASSLRARIRRDVACGLLPTTTDAAALAGLAMTVLQGLSVLARDGASRATLFAIVEAAMGAWPESDAADIPRTTPGRRRSVASDAARP